MISAKQQAFRQQIRRRQIDDKFRHKRKQYMMLQKIKASRQDKEEFINETQSIIYNLTQLANGTDFYMYQGLLDLRELIKKRKKLLPTICNIEYKVVESLGFILERVNRSGLELATKGLVFDLMMEIMNLLISCQEITAQRVFNSGFINAVVPYLELQIEKFAVLVNLFGFLGNAVRQSPQVAGLYTEFQIPKLALNQLKNLKLSINIPQQLVILQQFLFFMRCYFDQAPKPLQLQNSQIQQCMNISTALMDKILQQNKHHGQQMQILQDSLKVYRALINYQKFLFDSAEAKRFIDIIQINGYPIEIKRQALYIVDSMIYVGDDDFVAELVFQGHMLNKIWGVDEEIKYIVFNIMSNVAVNPRLRTAILPFLSRIRLEINYCPDSKFVYRFVLNYFSSKKFKVQGVFEQSIIDEIYKNQITSPEVMAIQAKIWLGLAAFNYHQQPPKRILQARNIPEVDQIWFCLEKENRQYNEGKMEDFADYYEDNDNKIISE